MSGFKSRRNRIVSDDGFTVEIVGGRGGLRYLEGARTIEVDSEFWGGERGVTIYAHSIRSWTGAVGTGPVSPAEVERIARNIVDAFAFDGYSADINWAIPGGLG
jgi:hypothetical protein